MERGPSLRSHPIARYLGHAESHRLFNPTPAGGRAHLCRRLIASTVSESAPVVQDELLQSMEGRSSSNAADVVTSPTPMLDPLKAVPGSLCSAVTVTAVPVRTVGCEVGLAASS